MFYIFYYEVFKLESKIIFYRIVFNSSVNFYGYVLNEYYVKGLDMLNNLFGVIFRFREEFVVIIRDIEKKFYFISILLFD